MIRYTIRQRDRPWIGATRRLLVLTNQPAIFRAYFLFIKAPKKTRKVQRSHTLEFNADLLKLDTTTFYA